MTTTTFVTVQFNDNHKNFTNSKDARKWTRSQGLSVRNAEKIKKGDQMVYLFDSDYPLVNSPAVTHEGLKSQPTATATPEERPQQSKISWGNIDPANFSLCRGDALQAGDTILNFIPGVHLTLKADAGWIVHEPAPAIPGSKQRVTFGFRSVESGGISSYVINPEATYQISL